MSDRRKIRRRRGARAVLLTGGSNIELLAITGALKAPQRRVPETPWERFRGLFSRFGRRGK